MLNEQQDSSDVIDSLNGGTGNPTTLLRTNQVENIIAKLRDVIDELDKNFADAKTLILELARHLDETKQSEQCIASLPCICVEALLLSMVELL